MKFRTIVGLLWGSGNINLDKNGNIWQVIKVNKEDGFIDLGHCIKFKVGKILCSSLSQVEVINILMKYVPEELKNKVNHRIEHQGDKTEVICNHYSHISVGNHSVITAGNFSTAIAGINAKINMKECALVNAGHGSIVTTEQYSQVTTDEFSTVITGDYSRINAGSNSVITTGEHSRVIIHGESSIIKTGKYSKIAIFGLHPKLLIEGVDYKYIDFVHIKNGIVELHDM